MLIIVITAFVYTGTSWFLKTRMDGSYVTLLVITILGAVSLISMGLVVAARVTSEELAGGLLNLVTWPMMMLSGVWFSLEGSDAWVQRAAEIFPLTHILVAARAVMIDGAGFRDVLPQIGVLSVMSALFLTVAALIFRWRPR
jgi:ABC-type multidrug transport system permease subunit